ncbi:hypothetical protein B8W72_02180 [Pseudomonas putida]|uniref:Uncharacterized protein n=1 Tax=Pseudomonas putida TaxID=303 RepID=A0A1Y3LNK5_PSEPU|nr:hypothetical protein B8W72_02180 [Pseudomonas putida]
MASHLLVGSTFLYENASPKPEIAALVLAALAPLLGLLVLWSRVPLKVSPVGHRGYWFYPAHLAVSSELQVIAD